MPGQKMCLIDTICVHYRHLVHGIIRNFTEVNRIPKFRRILSTSVLCQEQPSVAVMDKGVVISGMEWTIGLNQNVLTHSVTSLNLLPRFFQGLSWSLQRSKVTCAFNKCQVWCLTVWWNSGGLKVCLSIHELLYPLFSLTMPHLSLICSQSQSLGGEGRSDYEKMWVGGGEFSLEFTRWPCIWECIFGVLKWGMQWKPLSGKVLDSVGFWTFHSSRIASYGQDNYTPSKFWLPCLSRSQTLISGTGNELATGVA